MSTVLFILAIVLCPIWIPLLIVMLFAMWFGILWMCGLPIQIKVRDEPIGYVRWFKFTRK